ncbi:hypothetical protein [Myroides odoratimimus]|uniref:hypothetical protein n=1 Tax=Myroides odoratimimus TaxID=76832 RepID=UPI002575BFA0|nr:hypothetical protein [Myroides odoratimimus]MDM1529773.1 hypothetical protein [Myroides odoratimimus]
MKKNIYFILFCFIIKIQIFAQPIGFNTTTPLNDMHLNGTLQITKEMNLGATAITKGNPGIEGQVLISQGSNKSPVWKTLSIPIVPKGSYSLISSDVMVDSLGAELPKGAERRQYIENERIDSIPATDPTAKWHILKQLTTIIKINKPLNRTNLILQTIGHLSDKDKDGIPQFTFAIGFFIGGHLKSVKPFEVQGEASSFSIVTLISTIENLDVGNHKLEVGVIPRLKSGYKKGQNGKDTSKAILTVGKPNPDSTNLTSFMTNSSLQIDVLEVLN